MLMKGRINMTYLRVREVCFSPRMLSNQIYSSKLSLSRKRGQLTRYFTAVGCQKNVSQEMILLTTRLKDEESGEQREGTSPCRQLEIVGEGIRRICLTMGFYFLGEHSIWKRAASSGLLVAPWVLKMFIIVQTRGKLQLGFWLESLTDSYNSSLAFSMGHPFYCHVSQALKGRWGEIPGKSLVWNYTHYQLQWWIQLSVLFGSQSNIELRLHPPWSHKFELIQALKFCKCSS